MDRGSHGKTQDEVKKQDICAIERLVEILPHAIRKGRLRLKLSYIHNLECSTLGCIILYASSDLENFNLAFSAHITPDPGFYESKVGIVRQYD